jgi:outer membrane immunogenic protein
MIGLNKTRRMRSTTQLATGISVLALLVAAGPAMSADLGGARRGQTYYEPVAPRTEIERWTGFYLGVTAGGSFGSPAVRGDFGNTGIDISGATGGVLAGYNWQAGRMVLGVESDFSLTNLDGARANAAGTTFKADIDKMGSMRGRVGFLMTPSMMLYATGGLAWAGVDLTSVGSPIRTSEFLRGWQLGTGVEWKFAPNWTLRTEYIYTDLGDRTFGVGGQTNQFDLNFHTVRAGLTFKF